MGNTLESQFVELISSRLGLRIREQDQPALWRKMMSRVRATRHSSLREYYHFLAGINGSAAQEHEWREIASLLTVTESYFLRDQGQFSLLRNHILPELIKRQSTLRVWSAGCSTGEEAYSLAILISELVQGSQPSVLILGTDINTSAIERAKRGVYSDWSFRCVDPTLRSKYFRRHRDGWEIDPKIKSMVTFQWGNLIQDTFPHYGTELHDIDLILCRNVFIYFDGDAIACVLNKFYNTLTPGGYLITGHTELHGQNIGLLQVKSFAESVIYERPAVAEMANEVVKLNLPVVDNTLSLKQDTLPKVSQTSSSIPVPNVHLSSESYLLEKAEVLANSGNYIGATHLCQQVLQVNPLSVKPYYLLAQIAEEQGDIEGAKIFLKRIIYLAPTAIYAYFELGCLYEKEKNWEKAQKSWKQAFDLLAQVSDQAVIDTQKNLTAAELKSHLRQMAQTSKHAALFGNHSAG